MNVQKIKMVNFLGTGSEPVEYELGRMIVLVGKNGAGKTSVLEAIRFILTGKITAPSALHKGATLGAVTGTVLDHEITRYFGSKSTVKFDGKTTTQKSVGEFLEKNSSATADTMRVITAPNMLSEMKSGELAEYMISNRMIPVEIDFDLLKELCPMSLPMEAELSNILPSPPETFTPETIQNVWEYYRDSLRDLRRLLKEQKAIMSINAPQPTVPMTEIEERQAVIASAEAEKKAYAKQKEAYDRAVILRKKAVDAVSELEKKLAAIEAPAVDPAELAFLQQKLEEHNATLSEIEADGKLAAANIKQFEQTLKNLDTPICPLSDKLVCATDKTAVREELTELLEQNRKHREVLLERHAKAKEKAETVKKKIEDYNTRAAKLNDYRVLSAEVSAKRSSLPPVPEEPVAPVLPADLEAEKTRLAALRKAWYDYGRCVEAQNAVSDLTERINLAEQCEELLNPKKGIREKIIAYSLEPIVEHCNAQADLLDLSIHARLRVENGVQIEVTKDNENWMTLKNASSGEQAIALFLVTDALNSMTGMRMLLLDDLDKLDANAFNQLLTLLERDDVSANYDQIVLCAVNHPDTLEAAANHPAFLLINV